MFLSDTQNTLPNQDNEYKDLVDIISSSDYRDNSKQTLLLPTNLKDIIDTLNREKPHIVHFSGHGSSEGKLEILDSSGHYDEHISGETLRGLFKTIKSVRFIFFNTCYSKSFGELLIQEIDYILVMEGKIQNRTAKDISNRFYKSFLANQTIQDSFKQIEVYLSNSSEKDIPKLLNRDNISDITIENITNPNISNFVKDVFDKLYHEQIILLLSQDYTDNTQYIRDIRDIANEQSDMEFYHFDIPSKGTTKKFFLENLAISSKIDKKLKNLDEFKYAMKKRLERFDLSHKKILLFITNFERGNIKYTKELAWIIRDLKMEENFFTIIIGGCHLASMRYEGGKLSPLNNAKEMFFPISQIEEDISKIYLGFSNFTSKKDKKRVCKYLEQKGSLGNFYTWSSNDNILNLLFWKNLIVNRDEKFIWKSETVRDIGREYLKCID